MIVSDFFHLEHMGDWSFDAEEWPDPAAMVRELESMGTKLMVSIWPCLSPLSPNYQPMLERGLLISSEQGPTFHATWPERGVGASIGTAFYDSTNPEARDTSGSRSRSPISRTESGLSGWMPVNPRYGRATRQA